MLNETFSRIFKHCAYWAKSNFQRFRIFVSIFFKFSFFCKNPESKKIAWIFSNATFFRIFNLSHFRLSAFPGFGHCQLILDYIDAHDLHETAQNKTASRILKDPPLNLNKPDSIQCCDFKKTSGQQLYRSIVLFEEKLMYTQFTRRVIQSNCDSSLNIGEKRKNETNKNIHQTFTSFSTK